MSERSSPNEVPQKCPRRHQIELKGKERTMKKLIIATLCVGILAGCSAMQKKADGRYFDIASNNNSEASIFLEKIIVDGKWRSGATGGKGCGGSNINGGGGRASPSYNTLAPQEYIYLEWYAWHEMARMKAKIELPNSDIVNSLLLSPPWLDKTKYSRHKSSFIIDFRPNNKVWIKLAKTLYPRVQEDIMILAEGQGIKTKDVVKDYIYYEEDEDYILNCAEYRKESERLGAYSAPLVTFDKWYTEFIDHKEKANE